LRFGKFNKRASLEIGWRFYFHFSIFQTATDFSGVAGTWLFCIENGYEAATGH